MNRNTVDHIAEVFLSYCMEMWYKGCEMVRNSLLFLRKYRSKQALVCAVHQAAMTAKHYHKVF